jgi:MYND finger
VCGLLSSLRCARCREVYYCGSIHQKKDWKSHRKACGQEVPPPSLPSPSIPQPSPSPSPCDCGEPGCVFTKEEAQRQEKQIIQYRKAIFSDNPEQLTKSERYWLSVTSRPPWMEDEEWGRVLQKHPHFRQPSAGSLEDRMTNQLVSHFDALINPK